MQNLPQQVGVYIETADGMVPIQSKNAKGKLDKTSLATSGLGLWGKARGHNLIPGRTAEAISKTARPKLVFHIPGFDFGKIRMVRALNVKKGKRNFVNAKSGFAGKGMESDEIAFTSTPAGAGYFIIHPRFELASGEYALIDYGRNDEPAVVWDFAVR